MEPLKVMTVCTGNICRSPLSEYFLRDALDADYFAICSAGTNAAVHTTIPKQQVAIADQLGLGNIVEHVPRQIASSYIRGADLILTASLRHRSRVVRALPSSSNRTFTMREYAYLAAHVEDADLIELLAQQNNPLQVAAMAVHRLRGEIPQPEEEDAYDIVDPYGASNKTYRKSAQQLIDSNRVIVEFLQKVASYAADLSTSRTAPHQERRTSAKSPSAQPSLLQEHTAPTTLGGAISLQFAEASRASGKHSIAAKHSEPAKPKQQIGHTSRDLPVSNASRGKHRRYAK